MPQTVVVKHWLYDGYRHCSWGLWWWPTADQTNNISMLVTTGFTYFCLWFV